MPAFIHMHAWWPSGARLGSRVKGCGLTKRNCGCWLDVPCTGRRARARAGCYDSLQPPYTTFAATVAPQLMAS
jgi:hypothetical protein